MSPQVLSKETQDGLDAAYRTANGPFSVRTSSGSAYVVMSASDYAQFEPMPSEAEILAMDEGFAAAQRGETVDADVMIADIRGRYGL